MLDEMCFEEIIAEIKRKNPLWHRGIYQEKHDPEDKVIYSFIQYTAKMQDSL